MKRRMILLFAIGMIAMSNTSMASSLSTTQVRKETRFLTDKMAYELNMNSMQYDDAFEINFDFIFSVRDIMDDVVRGYGWAIDRYYQMLDIRNDDLRWVLSDTQYRRFMITEDFYRPIYANTSGWNFRIYVRFPNLNLFFFGKPRHYTTYKGGHYRTHHNNNSYYRGRYTHRSYNGHYSVRHDKVYHNHRRSDFGSIKVRPNSNKPPQNNHRPSAPHSSGNNRPNTRPSDNKRPGNNASTPNRRPETTRPSNNQRPSSGTPNRKPETTRPSDNKRPSSGTNASPGSSSTPNRKPDATRPSDNRRPSSGNNSSSGSSSSSNRKPEATARPSGNKQRPTNNNSSTNSSSRPERKPAGNNSSGNSTVKRSSSENTRRSSSSERSGSRSSDNSSSRSSGNRSTRR
ncbi:MAG: hypothetical protein LUH22_13235 [Bacteroides sp.]|nr:hypothetical protein [Bacteroides sp.]